MNNAVFIIIAIVGWGVWAVTQKMAIRTMSPMLVTLCSAYVYSAIAPVAFLAMKARGDRFDWTAPGIFWTTASSLLATCAGYAYLFALQNMQVHRVIAWTSTYPILTFVLCMVCLGEAITWWRFAGVALISVGTYLATR